MTYKFLPNQNKKKKFTKRGKLSSGPRILLIRHPAVPLDVGFLGKSTVGKITEIYFPKGLPLGMLNISSYLKSFGFQTYVYDALQDFDYKSYLGRNDLKFDGFLIGANEERIIQKIKEINPDYIGISNQFTSLKDQAIKLARLVKSVNSEIVVMIGGAHASTLPEEFEKEDCIDIVVGGEGEEITKYILENNIKKGTFLNNHVENLDRLPFPDYQGIDMEKYFEFEKTFSAREKSIRGDGTTLRQNPERYISMITSRGCPYNCCFCTVHNVVGRIWRPFSVEYVVNHIKHVKEKYKVNHYHFEDDNMSLDLNRFKEILKQIKKLRITWDTPNGVRADRLDEEAIILCKESGCEYLVLGIEHANQWFLDNVIDKNIKLKDVIKTIKLAKKHQLKLKAFYIIGFPEETRKDIENTLNFALKLYEKYDVKPSMGILHPYIGSRVYQNCLEKGLLTKSINKDHVDMIKTKEFDEEYLEEKFKIFYYKLNEKNKNKKIVF